MFLLSLSVFGSIVCSKKCPEPTGDPSFSADIQPLFTAKCALSGCHDVASTSGGLVLSEGQAYLQLVNVSSAGEPDKKRILPGDAGNSYLIMKLEGRQSVGEAMPPGGTIRVDEIQLIRAWVGKGATDN